MNLDIAYTQVEEDNDLEDIGSKFCIVHGDSDNGTIPDDEYDRLFDHVGAVISKYASYSGDEEDADFIGSRYVDQIPWITLVAEDGAEPGCAVGAA